MSATESERILQLAENAFLAKSALLSNAPVIHQYCHHCLHSQQPNSPLTLASKLSQAHITSCLQYMCYSACRKILVGQWNSHANTLTSWVSCVYSCYSFIPRPWIPGSIPINMFTFYDWEKAPCHYFYIPNFTLSKRFAERSLHVCMYNGTSSCILSSLSALFAFYHGKYSLQETLC